MLVFNTYYYFKLAFRHYQILVSSFNINAFGTMGTYLEKQGNGWDILRSC